MRLLSIRLWVLLLLFSLAVPLVMAASDEGILGDEDPYPLACLDFSGKWRSDGGETLSIEQGSCRWLRIRSSYDSREGLKTIVPDDKSRNISGNRWKGVIRHRWNNKSYATIVETHRTLFYVDKEVTELVILEKVNESLLLESLHRTTRMLGEGHQGEPQTEYGQRVFRLSGAGHPAGAK